MASLLSFVKNSVGVVTQYFSPRKPAEEAHEDEVEEPEDTEETAETAAEEAEVEEASPVRNLSSELEKASDGVKEDTASPDAGVRKKRGRPPKKQTEGAADDAPSPKKSRKSSTTKTPTKTPKAKKTARTPKTPKQTDKEEHESEDEGEFVPKFQAGDKVEARSPVEEPEHNSWFNAVITRVLSDSKSYEVTWDDNKKTSKVSHKYVRERTPEESGEFADLHKGQEILGYLDPGYWYSATITKLETKNKKDRIFVSWNDISSRKRILSLDEVRPVKQK